MRIHLQSAAFAVALLASTTSALALPQPQPQPPQQQVSAPPAAPPSTNPPSPAAAGAKPQIQEDSGQVAINGPSNTTTNLPIVALTYTGDAGPHTCRGSVMAQLRLDPPATAHTEAVCYNLPRQARCAMFVANKADGCEARLFSMDGCPELNSTFVNLAVFVPEQRTVGGLWKSYSVRCGVEAKEAPVMPALPGMFG